MFNMPDTEFRVTPSPENEFMFDDMFFFFNENEHIISVNINS